MKPSSPPKPLYVNSKGFVFHSHITRKEYTWNNKWTPMNIEHQLHIHHITTSDRWTPTLESFIRRPSPMATSTHLNWYITVARELWRHKVGTSSPMRESQGWENLEHIIYVFVFWRILEHIIYVLVFCRILEHIKYVFMFWRILEHIIYVLVFCRILDTYFMCSCSVVF
jgi:hypothetical protein